MPETKPYHHGNLREALIEASLALIREVGIRGFTLREVARRAGVSHAAPYRHFRDKDDLLAVLAEQGFNRLTAAMRAAAARAHHPFQRLQNAGIAYIEFAQDDPERFQVMFSVELDPQVHSSAMEAGESSFAELVRLVAACPRPSDGPSVETLALVAWTQVQGIAELAPRSKLGMKSRKQLIRFAKTATDILGRGARLIANHESLPSR